jgi:hypothetical protein
VRRFRPELILELGCWLAKCDVGSPERSDMKQYPCSVVGGGLTADV